MFKLIFPVQFQKLKMESNSNLIKSETFRVHDGVVRFEWTIKDFKGFLGYPITIRSSSFEIKTTAQPTKVRSFHLEMEIPTKAFKMNCPVFLINESGENLSAEVALESYSPRKRVPTHFAYVEASLANSGVVQMSNERQKVLTVSLPAIHFPNQSETYFPGFVTIEIKVTLCQFETRIVSK
jgi:hypothetical protein